VDGSRQSAPPELSSFSEAHCEKAASNTFTESWLAGKLGTLSLAEIVDVLPFFNATPVVFGQKGNGQQRAKRASRTSRSN
jgi:hypothetical protein